MGSQGAADNKVTNTHSNSTVYEQSPAANLIDEEEHDAGKDDEEGVLDTGRNQVDVSGQASHLKDVDNVVGHD